MTALCMQFKLAIIWLATMITIFQTVLKNVSTLLNFNYANSAKRILIIYHILYSI